MDIKIIERTGIQEAIDEVTPTFFSGNRTEVERHFEDHPKGACSTLLGYQERELIGILTICWDCRYPPFQAQGIPFVRYIEIKWERRGQGLGNDLLAYAEQFAAVRTSKLGICVGVFDVYGPAQRLYVTRDFVPDGRGVCRGHVPLREREHIQVDQDLLLWLVKDLVV